MENPEPLAATEVHQENTHSSLQKAGGRSVTLPLNAATDCTAFGSSQAQCNVAKPSRREQFVVTRIHVTSVKSPCLAAQATTDDPCEAQAEETQLHVMRTDASQGVPLSTATCTSLKGHRNIAVVMAFPQGRCSAVVVQPPHPSEIPG